MRVSVIVAAGGAGKRLGADRPKALVPVGGAPLYIYSIRTFASLPFVREIVLVLPGEWVDRVRPPRDVRVVAGGARRQDSVRNGLKATDPSSDVVLVHDAARPFATPRLIRAVAEAARRHGAAVPGVPVVDTIKIVDGRGRVVETPPRDRMRAAQTPQGFRRELLVEAYRRAGRRDATDDVQLVERIGGRVVVVEGDPANYKLTTPEDFRRAEAKLVRRV